MLKLKKQTKYSLALLLAGLTIASDSFALQEIMKTYRGPRSLGMGGLVTTTGLYDEALFGNPATQMDATESKFGILNIQAEANSHFINNASEVNKIKGASGSDVVAKIAQNGLAGKNMHLRSTILLPSYYNPTLFGEKTGFSFSYLVNMQANVMLRANASAETQTFVDTGPALGFGHKLLDDSLYLGVNVRTMYRLASQKSIRALEFLGGKKLSLSDLGGQGLGIDGDVGAMYIIPFTPPFLKRLSAGFSVNNVARSNYRVAATELIKSVKGASPRNSRLFNFGLRGDLPDFWLMSNTLAAIELQDFGQTDHLVSFWKRAHLGTETTMFSNLLALRLGLNQGYVSGGIGVNLPVVKINLASYGEELGATTGQLEDRRYLVSLAFEI